MKKNCAEEVDVVPRPSSSKIVKMWMGTEKSAVVVDCKMSLSNTFANKSEDGEEERRE